MAVLLGAVAGARGQAELDGPPSPSAYVADALSSVEGELVELLAEANTVERGDVVALDAKTSYRLIVRRLLLVSRDAGDEGAVAAVTAINLIEAAPQVDALIDSVPIRAKAALEDEQPDRKEIRRLKRAIEALRTFNRRVDETVEDLTRSDSKAIDAYAQRMLTPLAVVVSLMDQPIQPGWPQPAALNDKPDEADAAAGWQAATVITKPQLIALRQRIGRAEITNATRQELRETVGRLLRAHHQPDLQPAVAELYHHTARLTDAADAFATADWLDELSRTQVARQVHDAAVLLKDPKTRDSAVARIDRLAQATEGLNAIGRLGKAGFDTTNLGEVLMAGYRLGADRARAETADQLLSMVSRITTTAERQRALKPGKLPPEIQTVFQAVQVQYANREKRVIAELPRLVADPKQVATPRWIAPVTRLESLGAVTERLSQVPDWMERMRKLNPVAAKGFYNQLRFITADLLNDTTHGAAATALGEIDRQLAMFERLPHEASLDDAASPLRRSLGDLTPDIKQQLEVLRSQWAAAWSARSDPTEPGRKLLLMRRLFEQLHNAAAVNASTHKAARLNHWAAWAMPPGSIELTVAQLPDQLTVAAAQAAAAQWDALATSLGTIERQAAVARLGVLLLVDLGDALPDRETTYRDRLGQVLFSPPPDGYRWRWRQPLARLSLLMRAAAHAESLGHDARAVRLRQAAGDAARQLVREIIGAPANPPPAEKTFEAIDV